MYNMYILTQYQDFGQLSNFLQSLYLFETLT